MEVSHIVKHFERIVLNLLAILFLSLPVYAEEELSEAESAIAEAVETNSGIISQNSQIIGYQPLMVAGQQIEATYLEETLGERYGAIILLHDRGENIEGSGVITPLRHQLPQYGWSTLTLALDYPFEPAILLSASTVVDEDIAEAESTEPATEASLEESTTAEEVDGAESQQNTPLPPISNQQRIKAAIAFLQEKDINRILFLGHGAGANLAVELLGTETVPIHALILVATPALTADNVFKAMQQPILDVYGSMGLEGVAEAVQQRKLMMKRAGNNRYSAREIIGADHFFTGAESALVNNLRGWLKVTFIDQQNDS